MEQQYITLLIEIILTLALSAFFSGMEIAFVSSNRMLAEVDKAASGLTRRITSFFYRHPNDFVSTMLVGNNIVLVVYGVFIARLFDETIFKGFNPTFRVTVDTILSTIIVLFTGEFLPKTLFKNNPNRLLGLFSLPAYLFYVVLWPISRFSTIMSRLILRLVGAKVDNVNPGDEFTKVDLDYLVQSSLENAAGKKTKVSDDVRIFQKALDFGATKVRDCMVPRTEIYAVEEGTSFDRLRSMFMESGKSKILVYRGDIDHIVGYIHNQELFNASDGWQSHIRTIPFVPGTMSARKVMQMLMQQKKSLCVVVDQFGGTFGIISLEDIVETIFGDIEDEHDNVNLTAQQQEDGTYLISGRMEISKVNRLFGIQLPESEDYMTVGGLILHRHKNFPKLNDVVKIGKFEFTIVKNSLTKIELVRLRVLQLS